MTKPVAGTAAECYRCEECDTVFLVVGEEHGELQCPECSWPAPEFVDLYELSPVHWVEPKRKEVSTTP